MKVVLDPGVLVAAAIAPSGTCGRLLRIALAGRYGFVVCPHLLAELEDVLTRPKFRRYLSDEQARHFVGLIAVVGEYRPDPIVQAGITTDPDDDYLVSFAQAAAVDYLISGDSHLTELDIEPPILTPRDLLERLE